MGMKTISAEEQIFRLTLRIQKKKEYKEKK